MVLPRVNRADALVPAAIAVAVACGLLIGFAGAKVLLVAVAAGVAAWVLTQPWGAVAVVAPTYLFPYGYGPIPWAATMLAMSVAYWALGAGRPRLPWTAIVGIVAIGFVFFARALSGGYNMLDAINVPLLWLAGVILGASVMRNRVAIIAIGLLCVPCALLALWEVSGHSNFWANKTGAAKLFGDLASQQGAGRALSTFGHPLIAGDTLAVMCALVLAAAPGRWRIPLAAAIGVGVAATVSRSSLAGLGAGIAVYIGLQSWKRLGWTIGGAVIVGGAFYALVKAVPALDASFSSRFSETKGQGVREYGREQLWSAIADPWNHLIGGGFRSVIRYMDSFGGVNGFSIFDNWYPTAIWDIGWIPLLFAGALAIYGLRRADAEARRMVLPALVVVAVVLFFTDGVYWFSWRLTSGLIVGAILTPKLKTNARSAPTLPH